MNAGSGSGMPPLPPAGVRASDDILLGAFTSPE